MVLRMSPRHLPLPLLHRAYTTTTTTTIPPPKGAAKLTDRTLISIRGADAPKFLQGLVTSQVPPPAPEGRGSYSCFLNSQGRVLSDAFIYPTAAEEPSYLIELSAPAAPHILTTLKRRRLRSKVSLDLVPSSELSVWAVWDDNSGALSYSSSGGGGGGIADERAPGFGARVVARDGEVGMEDLGLEQYTLRRYLWGVAEGREMPMESALPQQSNVDYMGGIDYRKGCYVGQELTIRTYHTGVVRRRVLPVQFSSVPFPEGEVGATAVVYDPAVAATVPVVESGAAVRRVGVVSRRRARTPGVVLGSVGNVGLALCRLGDMTEEEEGRGEWEKGDQFVVGEEGREVWVRAVVPWWHKERADALRR